MAQDQTSEGHSLRGSPLIPAMRYKDARAAISWLSEAFGFKPLLVVEETDGTVAHAELIYGGAMIMLGSATAGELSSHFAQPSGLGGRVTQCCYLIVADPDAHCARAEAAGADILDAPKDEAYGGRVYSCRDPEGHIWSFGTYDPWRAARTAT